MIGSLSLVNFHTSPLLSVQDLPNQGITKLSDHRRRENKHINHTRHHTHLRTKIRLKIRQVSGFSKRSPQERPPQLSRSRPRLNISKASTETKPSHRLLTLTVLFCAFSPSLFSHFTAFFFILLTNFRRPFFFISPIFPQPAAQEIFLMHSLVF